MANMYPHLLSPFKVGKTTFKNRILGGPLGNNEGNPGGIMARANIDYYGALARGGAARIVGGGDCDVGSHGGMMGLDLTADGMGGMDVRNSVRSYVYNLHRYDCLAFVQLTHSGSVKPGADMAPPGMGQGNPVDELSRDELKIVINDYVKAVTNARNWGLDGVLLHAGHCKLLDQFRARDFNHRTDEYGGSPENRCRFPIELLEAIRKAVGPDFIIEYRTSVDECVEGGITIDETIEFLKMIDGRGLVDLIHCTSGRHTEPLLNAYCISPATFPQAPHRKYCQAIKAAGIKTPLVIINSCADPDIAEDIIASGDADLVCMSRQINLADPYYPRKLREGRPELIDNCLRCHGCYDVVGPCYVNPNASFKTYETGYELSKTAHPRKVVVVGGGIAGMKAAFTAAERGHSVILFEAEQELGGQLRFADTDTYKNEIRRFKNSFIQRVTQHPNIRLRLGVKATPELIARELPCGLIIAIGGKARTPDIPGTDKAVTVMDSYLHPELVGDSVIMLGSGLTACEVGLHLHRLGKKVTIVGRREDICHHETSYHTMPTSLYSPIPTFHKWFEQHGIALYNRCECVEISDTGAVVKNLENGQTMALEADTVILAAGMDDRRDDALAYNDLGAGYFAMVGDCRSPGKIREAVYTGYFAGLEV